MPYQTEGYAPKVCLPGALLSGGRLTIIRPRNGRPNKNGLPKLRNAKVAGGTLAGGRENMSEKVYDVPSTWAQKAYVDDAKYQAMYAASIKDPSTGSIPTPR